jgi:predicted glycogen debranching enzyme
MPLSTNKSILQNFDAAIQREWLETNGLGGWAGSSLIGCSTRRYHGLLIAATNPPTERMALLSKLDESIVINNTRYELGTNQYDGNVIHPRDNQFLQAFDKDIFPSWTFNVNGIALKKTIAMVHNENTTLIMYDVVEASTAFSLELLPLISARGYHSLQHAYNNMWWDAHFEDGIFKNQPHEEAPLIYISVPGSSYRHEPRWFNKFNYAVEIYRGQDYEEDLFNHGIITVNLKEGDSIGIIVSTVDPAGRDAHQLFNDEMTRRKSLLTDKTNDETVQQLTLAADQFIVKRDEDLKTVIAGYHWFTDWGRDTMISLPGLCLSTGRFDDAKKIIAAFAKSVSMGMLPNRFQDNGEAPEYNNVDGTLWYFIAVNKYLQATRDERFVLNDVLPVLKNIIDWHHKGTRYHIHEEADGLLYSGEAGVQLTWMDAKVGDWVVTSRTGKAVEIQALWYNALRIFENLLRLNKEAAAADTVNEKAALTKESFCKLFWNEEANYLYDVIEGQYRDASLRPNQLFAISLPYMLVSDKQAAVIIKIIGEKLYTPVGLRSLSPDDEKYIGVYGGDAMHRDAAYHQGTVWSWLLGPYVDALIKINEQGAKAEAMQVIENFKYHLNEGCIGSVSEIFDGDAPHHPRGCVAQAWGVGEILRMIKDYELLKEVKTREKVKERKLIEA